jgi:tetratricopeptide (TPR) repeat protein
LHGQAGEEVRVGHFEKAIGHYSKALQLNETAGFHNDLSWLLCTCPIPKLRDPKRAVEHAKKAVELAQKEGGLWNTLGVAYYRVDDFKASIAALQRSVELRNGGDCFDWLFLAMAHWRLGHKDEGQVWYEKAVQWVKKNDEALKNNKVYAEELRRFRAEADEMLSKK